MQTRLEVMKRLASKTYDVCVIGGGASGAGCALDACLRGLSTALVEAGDFGSVTSSASTKLIHGGLRYLRQAVSELNLGQYRMVRKALRERRSMMRSAPHLTGVRRFAVPCFSLPEAAYYRVALKIYDWLSGESNLEGSFFEGRTEALARLPGLKRDGLYGVVTYADGQFDDARYNLALIQSCAASGADVLSYARVVGFEMNHEGRIIAAQVQATGSDARFKLTARVFINATGPFSDRIRRMASETVKDRLKLSRGVHILLAMPKDFGKEALLIPETEDGRVVFAIPWHDRLLVGTTETETTLDHDLAASKAEAEYLLRHLNRYLSKPLELSGIVSATVGLRPLLKSKQVFDPRKIVRDYEIETEARSGLISVLGGKWTVYRAMAEDAINAAQKCLSGRITGCLTRGYPLYGFQDNLAEEAKVLAEEYRISPDTIAHLLSKFGRSSKKILELIVEDASLGHPLICGAPQIRAEVVYSVREEMAMTLEDVLSRRLGLQLFHWGLAMEAAPAAAELIGRELGWTKDRTEREVQGYIEQIRMGSRALELNFAPAGTAR